MSLDEPKIKEKKDHPILNGVAIGAILLVVNTIYNLVLAHIWPVTIHFGDYSLANAIYIMVSVLTSLIIAYLTFYLAIFFLLSTIVRGLLGFMLTPEQRARKHSMLERTVDGLGFFFLLPFYVIGKLQNLRKPSAKSESAQDILEKIKQKQSTSEDKQ